MYAKHEDGDEFLFGGKNSNVDLEVEKVWKMFGGNMENSGS